MKIKYTSLCMCFIVLIISCSSDGGSDPEPAPILHPGNVTLISPTNNNLCESGTDVTANSSNVTFSWTTAENTLNYEVLILNLDTNQEYTTSNISTISFDKTLTKGHPYSWKVTSKNNESTQQGNSPTWKFYLSSNGITNYTPFPAELIYPENDQTFENNTTTILLDWIGSDIDNENLTYTIYLDNVDGLQDPIDELLDISNSEAEVALESNNSYYWRVKSSDGENSSYSQIFVFHVD